MKKSLFEANGISLSKATAKVGDKVEIRYHGLLKNSGAKSIKIHVGYNDTWENAAFIEMASANDAFSATVDMSQAGTFNFAFTDPAGNWDNNSGKDYNFKVSAAAKAKEATAQKAAKAPKTEKAAVTSPKTAKAKKEAVSEAKPKKEAVKKVKSADKAVEATAKKTARKSKKDA